MVNLQAVTKEYGVAELIKTHLPSVYEAIGMTKGRLTLPSTLKPTKKAAVGRSPVLKLGLFASGKKSRSPFGRPRKRSPGTKKFYKFVHICDFLDCVQALKKLLRSIRTNY